MNVVHLLIKLDYFKMSSVKPNKSEIQRVLMLGTGLDTPGGMTSVVRTLKETGLFDSVGGVYVPTYIGPRYLSQIIVLSRALFVFLFLLTLGRVSFVHANSASRGSFWRKSIFCGIANIFSVPYVFHIHSGEFPLFYERECGTFAKWWVRRTLRNAVTVVCLTKAWKSRFSAIEPRARLVVIGNPVFVPANLPPLRELAVNVLFLGRLRQKKGIFDLVRAWPSVLKKCPQLRLIVAGDDGEDAVMACAAELGVADSIDVIGWVDGEAKMKILAKADIFVLPSYFEGLPVGLLEAMALGIPIVSTSVGGIPDLIEDRVHGLLVPPGDLSALGDAIGKLGSDVGLRVTMREAAYKRAQEHYSLPVIHASFRELYREIEYRKKV